MDPAEDGHSRLLEWSISVRPFPGEAAAGDRAIVRCSDGRALVAAVDGLGHGPEATRAADVAVEVLGAFAHEPVDALVERCHQALASTRGAAVSLAEFTARDGTMTWLGVGDVDGTLVGPRAAGRTRALRRSGGIAGHQLPALTCTTVDVQLGDTLLLATDGIEERFAESPDLSGSTREIADRILAEHAKRNDDALVVVARYLGGSQ